MFTQEQKKRFAELFGYSTKLIYLEDIMKEFKEKVIEEDGSYNIYGSDSVGYKFVVKPEYLDDINNICKYAGCKFKGAITNEQIELIEKEKELKRKEQEAYDNFKNIGSSNDIKEDIKKAILNFLKGTNENVDGVYCLDRDKQYKLWKILEPYKIETSLGRVLKKVGVKISYGERDPKTNWSSLYIYEDNYIVNENKFTEYINKVINNYSNWQYIDNISDLMKLKYNKYYIYGIEVNNELIYIGKTYRGLRERILEHLTRDNNANKKLYEKFETEDFHIVILCEEYGENSEIKNDIELQVIEKGLIEYYKPICNIQGVKTVYSYK